MIDIIEQEITEMGLDLFNILLKDRTTQKNICWATDNYKEYGFRYYAQQPITIDLIIGTNTNIIQPRVTKAVEQQKKRTKDKGEVFTPSWVCNQQNNLVDEAWFGRRDVFNKVYGKEWISTSEKIVFPKDKDWKEYVDSKRIEISCGEAPYLVSRYDTVLGNEISIKDRIGILDRKLRIINENTETEEDWFKWVVRAYESTYGYEYQGDNVLIARENMLYTFIENMEYKFSRKPNKKQLKKIALIISWNIWQMDGITMTVPFSERSHENVQMTWFYSTDDSQHEEKEPIPCRIYDWRSNKSLEFKSILKKG
ncbi:MAG: restriction endonuclease subunit M [Clostridium sp.]|uniref:restriction endonuclease subunit M n=1 Tax=Clostridium sp. TaxID=1506 RepID=UPI0028FFBA16|nr:restriction endonuclease subunit M [Clostridium sp.]MDU1601573.1 restriction endonuclease subunit M [Clostridium sp.]